MTPGSPHVPVGTLLDYWLHDSDPATTDAVDEHLMQCDACGRALDELVALGEGVRAAFRAGSVATVASADFVQRLTAQGLRVREYRLPHNASVDCTVAPDDDLLVSRLEAPLADVRRLDVRLTSSTEPGAPLELADVPFDARRGEVLYLPKVTEIRQAPAHTMQLTLLAVEAGARREVGRYTFRHRPWAAP